MTNDDERHMAQTYRMDGIEGKVVPLYRKNDHIPDAGKMVPTLTDDEREAIEDAVAELTPGAIAATLRSLLARLA